MVNVESDGRVLLTIRLPGAERIEVVGAYDEGEEERWPMNCDEGGRWWIELPPAARPCREFLFTYLIDGAFCVLDRAAERTRTSRDGYERCRVIMPAAA